MVLRSWLLLKVLLMWLRSYTSSTSLTEISAQTHLSFWVNFWISLPKFTKEFSKIYNKINYICRSQLKELYLGNIDYLIFEHRISTYLNSFFHARLFSNIEPAPNLWEYGFHIPVTVYSFSLLFKCNLLIPRLQEYNFTILSICFLSIHSHILDTVDSWLTF